MRQLIAVAEVDLKFAQDSARNIDVNGWAEIKDNPISKVGVFPYLGRNVDASFPPDQVVMVLRPEEELSDLETIESFKLLPWIDDHVMLGAAESGLTAPEDKGIEGVIGETVYFDKATGKLRANIKVFSNNLDGLIDGGKRELSAGYRCKYEISSGLWNGQRYDAIQREIRGNHLALVKEGRMGPDVAVLDHFKFTFDARDLMPETKEKNGETGMDAVMDAIKEMRDEMNGKLGAMDKRITDGFGDPKEDCDSKHGKDSKAKDEDEGEEKKEDKEDKKAEDKKAMDASIKSALDAALAPVMEAINGFKSSAAKDTITEINRRDELASQLRNFGFAVDASDMSLGELRSKAIKDLGLKCDGGQEQAVLDSYFHNRKPGAVGHETGFALDTKTETNGAVVDQFFQ